MDARRLARVLSAACVVGAALAACGQSASRDAPDSAFWGIDAGADGPDVARADAGDLTGDPPRADVPGDGGVGAVDAPAADAADALDGPPDDLPPLDEGLSPPRLRPAPSAGAAMFVGAHPDDDLLFMSPDLLEAVRSGRPVRAIFTTAGDACETRAPEGRDQGLREAYTWMAFGEADGAAWTCGDVQIGPLRARECGTGDGRLSIVSLRLPDCAPALQELREGARAALATVAETRTLATSAGVVAALQSEFLGVEPAVVHTLDASDVYGHDNSDHVTTAKWVFDAAGGLPIALREHRCYNTDAEYVNVTLADQDAKWGALDLYCAASNEGADICRRASGVAFYEWVRRQYVIARPAPAARAGPYWLRGDGGCLAVGTDGAVRVECGEAATEVFAAGPALSTRAGARLRGGAAVLTTDAAQPDAVDLVWMTNGQLRAGAGRCVTEGTGGGIGIEPCRGEAREVAGSQRWSLAIAGALRASPVLSDDEAGANQRSFGVARGAGGALHVCVRAPDGVRCSRLRAAGDAGPATLWSAEFSTADGWGSLARDATIRFADIDGDGTDDVCGRGARGYLCGLGGAAAFGAAALWSEALSDEDPAWFEQERFATIQLGDVTGDARADLCARFPDGLRCAASEGGRFGAFGPASAGVFSDADGWDDPAWAGTIRIGDVTGDGVADACGRSELGPYCARGIGGGRFVALRFWGRGDALGSVVPWTTSEPYWATTALADHNRDGLADWCVRAPQGLHCALSTGTNFDALLPVGPFEDADGFEAEQHGGSLEWSGVGALRVVCARSRDGVLCLPTP